MPRAAVPYPQTPYVIAGHVRVNERASGADSYTNKRGAIVWAQDLNEGTYKYREKDLSLVYTNAKGEFIIDVANITTQYQNGDIVRLHAKFGDLYTYVDVGVHTNVGVSFQNIDFPNKSELKDGLKGTLDIDGQFGLESIGKGLVKGLKDGL